MAELLAAQNEAPSGLESNRASENRPPHRQFARTITVAWLSLGIAAVALALIAAIVLRSEQESTAVLHHMNLIALNLQDVLTDLADAEAEERAYVLTARPDSFENFERSRKALDAEFERLAGLVRNNLPERQEVGRVHDLVEQELTELQRSIATRAITKPQAATEIFTDRARSLTTALRQIMLGIEKGNEGTLSRLARQRRVRLASALAAVSGALLLAAAYLLMGQVIIARSESAHQETEAALRVVENRFETLCEQAPVGIYCTDPHGQCVYTNSRWCEMSGLTVAQSLGHGWTEALHPDDRHAIFTDWMTRALQGDCWEYRLLTPEGKIRWVRALGAPLYSPQGEITGYVGTTEDITERKRAHLDLQEREALNRAILNSLPANIAVLGVDGRIVAINEEWKRFAELNGSCSAPSVGVGVNYLEICRHAAGDDAKSALAGIQAVIAGLRRSFSLEYPCPSPAEKRWFQMLVTPLGGVSTGGAVVTHIDITERKKAEAAVTDALQQLQLITDNMPAGVTRCTSDLKYLWVSRSYAAWLGRTPAELSGQAVPDVIDKDVFEMIRPYIETVLSGKRAEYELQVDYPGVGKRWIHAVYVPTEGKDGKVDGWISVVADITDRREAQERVRESEERFRAVFYQAAVGIALSDLENRWIVVNDRFCELFGYSRSELQERTFIDLTHPDDRAACVAGVGKLAAGEMSSWSAEKRYISKSGVTVWGRVSLSLVRDEHKDALYFIGIVEDITRMIKAQESLRESEERFRNMADTAPVMIWVAAADKGCIFFNKTWLEFSGRTMEQELGSGWVECMHPDDRGRCVAVYDSAFDARQSFQMEYRLRRADGEYRWLLDQGVPRFTPANAFHGYIGSCIDITERKRAERELEESRQELRALAGRLIHAEEEERERIARELHDDLSQKLALLAFNAESLVLAPPPSMEEIREPLQALQKRIVQLSEDVRKISHELHPTILQDLGLTAALRELCDEFSAREGIEVAFQQDAVLRPLPIDVASGLYRVSQEALHNILKHAQATEVRLTVTESSEGIHLYIHDNGVGFQADGVVPRPGLGIVSMKERIGLLKGEFSIRSAPGQGTEVSVFVPLPESAPRLNTSTTPSSAS